MFGSNPLSLQSIPSRRKIIPKYKRLLKKQQSTTSETSSDDKNSLAASESSESEQQVSWRFLNFSEYYFEDFTGQ